MLNFTFSNTTKILFGRGMEDMAGEEIKRIASRVLIIGSKSEYCAPLLGRIEASLERSKLFHVLLTGVKPNPEISLVYEAIRICREQNIGFILAVGGGSIIDTAKAAAAGVLSTHDAWELFMRRATFDRALPLGVVVTIPAAGSEASAGAVISNPEQGLKMDIIDPCLRPVFAILNPELTITLPAWQTFCGIVDIMSHTMERYFTTTGHVDLIDRLSEGLLQTCIRNARILLTDPDNYDARGEIMWAGTISHSDLLGTGRKGDWASHWIGMAMSAVYDTTHGATLSIITPAWMKYVYQNQAGRFAQFAHRVFGIPYDAEFPALTARQGIRALEDFFNEIGVPTRLAQAGIPDESHFDRMSDIYEKFGAKGCIQELGGEDAKAILRLAK